MGRPKKIKVEEPIVETPTPTIPVKRKIPQIDLSQEIEIVNFTADGLIYKSPKSGRVWDMLEFGSSDMMSVDELKTMLSSHPSFLREPWLLIMDDEVVQYLNLTKLYENIHMPDEVDKLFALPVEKLKKVIETAPNGMKPLLVGRARLLINSGKLDSNSRIKLIEKAFNVKFDIGEE